MKTNSPTKTTTGLKEKLKEDGIDHGLYDVLVCQHYYDQDLQCFTSIDDSMYDDSVLVRDRKTQSNVTLVDDASHLSSFITPYYKTGFSYHDIIDPLGVFYIIHPCEHLVTRPLLQRLFSDTKETIKKLVLIMNYKLQKANIFQYYKPHQFRMISIG